jgi:hypothetical protein
MSNKKDENIAEKPEDDEKTIAKENENKNVKVQNTVQNNDKSK